MWEKKMSVFLNSFFLSCIIFLFVISPHVNGAVLGIDFGGDSLKVAVGTAGAPVVILENDHGSRKTPSQVGFQHNGERFFGEQAKPLWFPQSVFRFFKFCLGREYEECEKIVKTLDFPYRIVKDEERNTALFALTNGDVEELYSSEELVSMLLSYIKQLGERSTSERVVDCVIAVPPSWTEGQRRGIVQAAKLSGLSVLSLIDENVAAAVRYGNTRRDFEDGMNVFVYDMGAGSTWASVLQFSVKENDDKKKKEDKVPSKHAEVVSVSWDDALGTYYFDTAMMEHFREEFNAKYGKEDGFDLFSVSKRAVEKMRKACTRLREILSANDVMPIVIESIYNDIDFKSSLSRSQLGKIAASLIDRVTEPVKVALKRANMTVDDIDAVEVIGGGCRMPIVQEALSQFFGKTLRTSLNGDESIAFAAAYQAAYIVPGFRVQMIDRTDSLPYSLHVGFGEDADEESEIVLYEEGSEYPKKRYVNLKPVSKFFVSSENGTLTMELRPFYLRIKGDDRPFVQYKVATPKWKPDNSSLLRFKLVFDVSKSRMISLDTVTAVFEVNKTVEVLLNETIEESSSEENDPTMLEASSVEPKNETVIEYILEPKEIKLGFKEKFLISSPMNLKQEKSARKKMKELERKDRERKERAEARNSLESLLYELSDLLDDDHDLKYLTSSEKSELETTQKDVFEWLEEVATDGTSVSEFRKNLAKLEGLKSPLERRKHFHLDGPSFVAHGKRRASRLFALLNNASTLLRFGTTEEIGNLTATCASIIRQLETIEEELSSKELNEDSVYLFDLVEKNMLSVERELKAIGRRKKPLTPPKIRKPKVTKIKKEEDRPHESDEESDTNNEPILNEPILNEPILNEETQEKEEDSQSESTEGVEGEATTEDETKTEEESSFSDEL